MVKIVKKRTSERKFVLVMVKSQKNEYWVQNTGVVRKKRGTARRGLKLAKRG